METVTASLCLAFMALVAPATDPLISLRDNSVYQSMAKVVVV